QREYYLAAAAFAYAFLLPEDEKSTVSPMDPRGRLAVDFYNQGLAEGLASVGGEQVILESATYSLPFGNLTITIDPSQFVWAGYRFKRFVPVSHFRIRGLRNRYRQAGVGAPLTAEVEPVGSGPVAEAARKRIPASTKVPVTAFMRFKAPLRGVLEGSLVANLELYTVDQTTSLRVGNRDVPLEFESTASIAYQLEGAPVWDTEIAGFRFAETPVLGDGLMMLQPYRPGRIPVVVVHGTASSPARWAEMYNEISNDPVLRDRYQFWLFQYNTGQPVLYSAMLLRRALRTAVSEIDPDGKDAPLRRMVIIGHSQGGLLTRLMAVNSGTRFWDSGSKLPFEQAELPAETKALLKEAMFFESVPQLERVVFIATPHRGSFRAVSVVQRFVRRIITMPGRLVTDTQSVFNSPAFKDLGMSQLPTSIDNMAPDNRFVRTLADLPIDPRIKAHSIIPVNGAGPPDNLNDGVVTYKSAHIDGVASELIVRSSHSTQAVPETIEEVRRILREHLGVRTDAKHE
ncbi:MAG TPA: hypothetical protein VD867_02745, partial [Burkholderiales bacterium]|nr:hypothetical protein [Burkholderiales bacterium]